MRLILLSCVLILAGSGWIGCTSNGSGSEEKPRRYVDSFVDLHNEFMINQLVIAHQDCQELSRGNYIAFDQALSAGEIDKVLYDSLVTFSHKTRSYYRLLDSIGCILTVRMENVNFVTAETLQVRNMNSLEHLAKLDQGLMDLMDKECRVVGAYGKSLIHWSDQSNYFFDLVPHEMYDDKSDMLYSWPWSAFKNQTFGESLQAIELLKMRLLIFELMVTSTKREQLGLP